MHQHRGGLAGRLADDGRRHGWGTPDRGGEGHLHGMANGAPWRPTLSARWRLIPGKCP